MFEQEQKAGVESDIRQCGVRFVNDDMLAHFYNIAQHLPIDSDVNYQKASNMLEVFDRSIAQATVCLEIVESLRDKLVERMQIFSAQ